MATFRFRVTIQGDGKDETEAWNNAVDPDDPPIFDDRQDRRR